jgi:predicted nucleic acid-binding protein
LYTLETNAIIYYLKDDPNVTPFFQCAFDLDASLHVSAVTEAELFRYSKLSEDEARQIESLLRSVFLVPVDSQIARSAGLIGRTYELELADSIVAATALITGTTLLRGTCGILKRYHPCCCRLCNSSEQPTPTRMNFYRCTKEYEELQRRFVADLIQAAVAAPAAEYHLSAARMYLTLLQP